MVALKQHGNYSFAKDNLLIFIAQTDYFSTKQGHVCSR